MRSRAVCATKTRRLLGSKVPWSNKVLVESGISMTPTALNDITVLLGLWSQTHTLRSNQKKSAIVRARRGSVGVNREIELTSSQVLALGADNKERRHLAPGIPRGNSM